ncbi:MAG: hypothetical protein IEMM0002_0600 [bacterium]|nr:MAG: hypothetical protein IEMM0002_0600 [bacterium]
MNKKKKNKYPVHQEANITTTHVKKSFSGPLPPPEAFARYNDILPGAADRILSMSESQSKHRHYLEKMVVWHNEIKSYLGMLCGTIITLTAIVGGIYLIINGYSSQGLASIITSLAGLVGIFIYGKKRQAKELKDKQQL